MATKRKTRKKSSSKGFLDDLVDMDDLMKFGAVGGGVLLGKASNKYLKKLPFIGKHLTPEYDDQGRLKSKAAPLMLAGTKVAAGYLAYKKMDNDLIKNAGIGVGAVGVVEGISILFPDWKIEGIGYTDDTEMLGTTVEINLDDISGSDFDNYLESDHQVAGHFLDEDLEYDEELAGEYDYEEEFEYA